MYLANESFVRPSALLCGMPAAPWLTRQGEILTRGQARSRILELAAQLRQAAEPGPVAWLAQPSPHALLAFLAALEAGFQVSLLPLRASDTQRRERIREEGIPLLLQVQEDGTPSLLQQDVVVDACEPQDGIRVLGSGSSGRARWTSLDLRTLAQSAQRVCRALAARPGDGWLLSLPLDHVSGQSLLWRSLVSRGCLLFPGEKGLLQDLKDLSPTHVSLVSQQLDQLLRDPEGAMFLQNLRSILLGGGPLSRDLLNKSRGYGLPLHLSYGSTESCAALACGPVRQAGSARFAGRPLPGVLLRQRVDSSWMLERANGTQSWRLPDVLIWRPAGKLEVMGRLDRVLISGGEKIHAEELEKALLELTGVEQAVVVPVTQEPFGDRPAVFLRMSQGRGLPGLEELRDEVKKFVSPIWLPVACWTLPDEALGPLKPKLKWLEEFAADRYGQLASRCLSGDST